VDDSRFRGSGAFCDALARQKAPGGAGGDRADAEPAGASSFVADSLEPSLDAVVELEGDPTEPPAAPGFERSLGPVSGQRLVGSLVVFGQGSQQLRQVPEATEHLT